MYMRSTGFDLLEGTLLFALSRFHGARCIRSLVGARGDCLDDLGEAVRVRRSTREAPRDSDEKPSRTSKLVDVVEFSVPTILLVGLALDGMTGGRILYATGWSILLPFSESFQVVGTMLLFGLTLFTTGAYLTGEYVYSKRPEERTLLQRGPYAFIRHPIYLSLMLVGAGFILLAQNLIVLPLLTFSPLRCIREERNGS